ncbi:kinase-like domain-containing protein, partial [Cyathus striatus]
GLYGDTYEAIDRSGESMELCAVKIQRKASPGSRDDGLQRNEVRLLKEASGHENIVAFRNYFENDYHTFLVMELCPGYMLCSALELGFCGQNDDQTRHLFKQIVAGVKYLHQKGIYHLDLKPDNMIVSKAFSLKIVDFGFATDSVQSRGRLGTYEYMAPEIHSEQQWYNSTVDTWALGITLIFMISGRVPWKIAKNEDETYSQYVRHWKHNPSYFRRFLPISSEIEEKLSMILHPLYERRTGISYIERNVVNATTFY